MSISKFNINADFIVYEHITINELKKRMEQPYQTKGGIFALCDNGFLKTVINHTRYRIGPNDLIVIPPETFVQLQAASDDIRLHVVMFSQHLIQNADMGKRMMDKFHIIGKHFIFALPKVTFQLYKEMFTHLSHLYEEANNQLSQPIQQILLTLMLQGVTELCPEQANIKETPGSRNFHQYRIFIRMVHAEYALQHQVAYYAHKMDMKPATLCRLVKKESGHTAMEIINRTIIMDAKAQLRTSEVPVKDIALNLGFNNAAFFNKFFKRHVGMTPQMFRNYQE